MKIQLLSFPGCPNVEATREALRRALISSGLAPEFEEVDVTAQGVPEPLRNWGSPTVLIDGRDVAGGTAADGESCRTYEGGTSFPPEHLLRAAIAAVGASRRSSGFVGGTAGVASLAAGITVLTSICCVGPAVVALLGVGGAVAAAALEPWRPWLLAGAVLSLAAAFWRSYRPVRLADGTACPIAGARWSRFVLWFSAAAVAVAASLPLLSKGFP